MSTHVDYLIIGGGVAGTTAAESIRARDKVGRIAIVSEESYRFYSRILLSKPTFFLERIPFDSVWLKKETWYTENNIQLMAGVTATRLNTKDKVVGLDNGQEILYGKMLLAVGGCARQWEMPGAEKKGINYLRTLDDGKAVMAGVKKAKRAVCVGSGFVSFEMCEMLRMAGVDVTLVMREPHYWYPLMDANAAKIIEEALIMGGVTIIRENEVKTIEGGDQVAGVILADGKKLVCDMIIVGIGLTCPFGWISAGGIAVNRGILTNEFLETNVPDIWAAGDAAEFKDLVLGEQIQLGNWVNAQMQGRLVGGNMVGDKKEFKLVSFYTAQGFDVTIAFVGDVRPIQEHRRVTRVWSDGGAYSCFFLDAAQHLIGATLINRTQDLGAVRKLIGQKLDMSSHEKELSDPAIDLKQLVQSNATITA